MIPKTVASLRYLTRLLIHKICCYYLAGIRLCRAACVEPMLENDDFQVEQSQNATVIGTLLHCAENRFSSLFVNKIFWSLSTESVWPLPTHFTPRLLYKLKVDDSFVEPLPVMPWEMVKKEVNEDEEREERQSGSSDSD